MAESVSISANAKLNLSLDITGKRPDGYHTVEMVMQSVDISDTLNITKTDSQIEFYCNNDEIENDKNLCVKAAQLFFENAEISGGAQIKLKKRIPIAAGLGGGSADAAAVLIALNELYNQPFDDEELLELALKIGADVPFCLVGGTQLAEGVGSILSPLPTLNDCAFVIVKSGEKPSTAQMYAKIDSLSEEEICHPRTQYLVDAICEGDNVDAGRYMSNVFNSLWDFAKIREIMTDCGAQSVSVSGSGPSVFGFFTDIDDAKSAENKLKGEFDEVYLCEPVDKGCEID